MNLILKHYEKLKFFILVFIAASLPYYIQISSILIGAAALLTILKAFSVKKFDFKSLNKFSIFLVTYFIIELVGLLYTDKENISLGLFTLEKHQALLLMPIIFSDFEFNSKQKEILFSTFIMSCFIGTLICIGVNIYISLISYDTFLNGWRISHDRVSEPIGMQAVYFAMYLSLSVLIILFILKDKWFSLSNLSKVLLLLLTIYFFAVITALGARTIIVSLIMIIILDLLIWARSLKSFKVLILATITPLIFTGFILLNPVVATRFMDLRHNKTEGSNYDSYFARTKIWIPGIEAIRENFWFGVGTGDHDTELNKKFLKYNYPEGIEANLNMHSQYLQSMLNYGIPGLATFLLIGFVQFRASIRVKDMLYMSFLLLFMLGCFTESMLSRNKGIIFFLVFSFVFHNSNHKKT